MAPPKAKGQKMGLGEFLTDSSLGSWADEMEDAPMPSVGRSTYSFGDRSHGSGGPGLSAYTERNYSVRETLPLPTKPPYTVHIGNMSFDSTEGDVMDLFSACEVTHVRIVEDKIDKKPKGFAYAEFQTLEGLKKALDFNGTQFQGRNIRVSVAEPQKDRPDARELNDWTRKGPLPDLGPRGSRDRPGFGGRTDPPGEGGADRPGRKFGYDQNNDGKVRDFSNWERKGPLAPSASSNAPSGRSSDRPTSREGFRDRRSSPAWGEGRSQDGSRPPRREFAERPAPERAPTAADLDNQWRLKMRPDAPTVQPPAGPSGKDSTQSDSPTSSTAGGATQKLTTRPKLNLQKRTVSQAESPVQASAADPKVSPFGAARPIDTSAREKEVEEKRRLRKEQEDKAREEKRLADEKAKEERRLAKEQDKSKGKANGNAKEGDAPAGPSKNYQILRRDADDTASAAGKDEVKETANGLHASDEGDAAPAAAGESRPPDEPASEAATPVPQEDDGWSTVSKPQKNRRGGHHNSARAGA